MLPAPADVQTSNGASTVGLAETGDTITLTFAGAVTPSLVLSGWDGSVTPVIVHVDHAGAVSSFTVQDTHGADLTALGSVDLIDHYTNTVDFTGSTMTASGNAITIVLGTPSGAGLHTISVPTTMKWTAPTGTATESGVPDVEF